MKSEPTASYNPHNKIGLLYHSHILSTLSVLFVAAYLLRAAFAESTREFVVLAGLGLVLSLFLAAERFTRDYKLVSFLLAFAVVLGEGGLCLLGLTYFTQFLFVIPLVTVFVCLMSGMVYGAGIALVSMALGMFFVSNESASHVYARISSDFTSTVRGFLFYMLGTQALIIIILLRFQKLLSRGEKEIKQIKILRARESRRVILADTIGKVAHEINNPMAILDSAFRLLKDVSKISHAPDRKQSLLLHMLEAQKRLAKVLESLQVSESVQSHEALQAVDLGTIIDRLHTQLGPHSSRLVMKLPLDSPVLLPRADRLQYVLLVLINNALDFSEPAAKVTLAVSQTHSLIRFEVLNQGRRITSKDSERIFSPFFTTKPPGSSIGMSLSNARSIVQELGGTMGFVSDDSGTKFWFELLTERSTHELSRL